MSDEKVFPFQECYSCENYLEGCCSCPRYFFCTDCPFEHCKGIYDECCVSDQAETGG